MFVKPSATMATIIFKDYFTLTNNGGQVEVSYGKFTEKAFAQIYKEGEYNYIATGYIHPKQADGYYHIIAMDEVVATVNGVEYDNLYYAIQASSAKYPAVLQRDYTRKSKFAFQLTNRKTCVLDLNGKTLTLDYSGYTGKDKQEFFALRNIDFTIQGSGTIEGNGDILFLLNGNNKPATNYTVLTIGKDVTLRQKDAWYCIAALSQTYCHGVVVNFNGKADAQCAFYVNGTINNISETAPVFNISNTATFDCASTLAYAGGYARWNYAGNATVGNFGVEVRAGEFTMNGGSIISTATQPADDQGNGSGSTSQASAIAACQHNTKLPIKVLVEGGLLKAYTPIYQANPQNNEQEAIDKVSVVVNNAQVFSTSKNIVWSANKKVVLNGGVYNLSPSQYVADGKVVVANEDAATKDEYPYTIGDKPADITFTTAGDWSTAANWSNTTGSTSATPVLIAANVVIPEGVTAEAYGITVAEGKTITIKAGGKLLVGKGGIAGLSGADKLKIEDGGILAISPAAEANNRPLGTMEKKMGIRNVEDEYNEGFRAYKYIWENIAIPTVDAIKDSLTVNYWNIKDGYKKIDSGAMNTPFQGYHVTVKPLHPQQNFQFSGALCGNQDATLTMPQQGFHFFGNSWSAPMDVTEILNQIEHYKANVVNSGIKVYVSDHITIGDDDYWDGTYLDVNRETLKDAAFAEKFSTIRPMEGFFMFSNGAAEISLNYEKAVWNIALASSSSTSKKAARYIAPDDTVRVSIKLSSSNGRMDRLYLSEGKLFQVTKMMNARPNVNIYAIGADGNYSTYGVEERLPGLEIGIGTNVAEDYTLSFDHVTGEVLYIKDLQTGIVTEMSDGNSYTFTAGANTASERFRIVSRSEVTTGVDDMTTTDTVTPTTPQGIYSVTGQYLGDAGQQNALPAGVYIINGKKVVK